MALLSRLAAIKQPNTEGYGLVSQSLASTDSLAEILRCVPPALARLPAAHAADIDVNEIRTRVIADTTSLHRQRYGLQERE